jgi:hypothetical protein
MQQAAHHQQTHTWTLEYVAGGAQGATTQAATMQTLNEPLATQAAMQTLKEQLATQATMQTLKKQLATQTTMQTLKKQLEHVRDHDTLCKKNKLSSH